MECIKMENIKKVILRSDSYDETVFSKIVQLGIGDIIVFANI